MHICTLLRASKFLCQTIRQTVTQIEKSLAIFSDPKIAWLNHGCTSVEPWSNHSTLDLSPLLFLLYKNRYKTSHRTMVRSWFSHSSRAMSNLGSTMVHMANTSTAVAWCKKARYNHVITIVAS